MIHDKVLDAATVDDVRNQIEEVDATLRCLADLDGVRDTRMQFALEGLHRTLSAAADILMRPLPDAVAVVKPRAAGTSRIFANRVLRRPKSKARR